MSQTETLCRSISFSGQRSVTLTQELLPKPNGEQVLIETLCSAISAGTEMLVYRGQLPKDMAVDSGLEALEFPNAYPMPYGYACVGIVIECGDEVDRNLLGKTVFIFHPHSSHILTSAQACIVVPEGIAPEAALFLANMETAINLAQDIGPLLGERGVILGQGIVGLLLSALLSEFPLSALYALDNFEQRREQANRFEPVQSFAPSSAEDMHCLREKLFDGVDGADFIAELTGSPDALNLAIDLSGYGSRIIIGSWYGDKSAPLSLGGKVHRNRLTIYSSQVSTIAPQLSARWTKERRFDVVWDAIRRHQPQKLISDRVRIEDASGIYDRLDSSPENIVQAVLVY